MLLITSHCRLQPIQMVCLALPMVLNLRILILLSNRSTKRCKMTNACSSRLSQLGCLSHQMNLRSGTACTGFLESEASVVFTVLIVKPWGFPNITIPYYHPRLDWGFISALIIAQHHKPQPPNVHDVSISRL